MIVIAVISVVFQSKVLVLRKHYRFVAVSWFFLYLEFCNRSIKAAIAQ